MKRLRKKLTGALGKAVSITFLDHTKNGKAPIEFIAYGRLVEVAAEYINLETWTYPEIENTHISDDNVERFTIVLSTVSKIMVLGKGKKV